MGLFTRAKRALQTFVTPDGQTTSSGTDLYLSDAANYYESSSTANAYRTAAVQFALNEIARAFMAAEVTPRLPGIGPLALAMIARQTIGTGNAVFEIDVPRTGNIRLLPVIDYKIAGGRLPESWMYSFRQQEPNGDNPVDIDALPVRATRGEGMVHVRYMPHPSAPWNGISPLIAAGFTAESLAKIERSLAYETGIPTGNIMPLPDGVTPATVKKAQGAVTAGKGGLSLLETTGGGFGQGAHAAPKRDWMQQRFGPDIPQTSINQQQAASASVMAALGVPPSSFSGEGSALRESYRHLMSNTIIPLGRLISEELSEKLERRIVMRFPERILSDISAISRAYGSLSDHSEVEKILSLPPNSNTGIIQPSAPNMGPNTPITQNGQTNGRNVHVGI